MILTADHPERQSFWSLDQEIQLFATGIGSMLQSRSRGDLASGLIAGAFTGPQGSFRLRSGYRHLQPMRRLAETLGADPTNVLAGQQGWSTLEKFGAALEDKLRQITDRYSPAHWYALLARVNHLLRLGYPATGQELVVLVAGRAMASERRFNIAAFLTLPWRMPPSVLTSLDDGIFVAMALQNVRVAQRRIGKGQNLRFDLMVDMVLADSISHEIEADIDLYDSRVASSSALDEPRLGTSGGGLAQSESPTTVVMWASVLDQSLSIGQKAALLDKYDPYLPMLVDLRDVAPVAFSPVGRGLTLETQALVIFLDTYLRLLAKHRRSRLRFSKTWSRFGYLLVSRRDFMAVFRNRAQTYPLMQEGWVSGTIENALEYLRSKSLLIESRAHAIMNAADASGMLPSTFNRPLDGPVANEWATSFEERVQALIDMSSWRPSGSMRSLIRKKLRRNGKYVTDIDAVAHKGDTLLLIDCKAFRMSSALATGEYSAIKTMREKVETACDAWIDRLAVIHENPSILNVSLPGGTNISGVVVVPFPPFVNAGRPTEECLSGLMRVASVSELMHFLH